MSEPTTMQILRRHDLETDRFHRLSYTPSGAHVDRGILLKRLEAAEQDFNQVFKTYVEQANALETAEKIIKDVSKLQRWTAENMDINTRDVQFTTQPDGEVILFAELEKIINRSK